MTFEYIFAQDRKTPINYFFLLFNPHNHFVGLKLKTLNKSIEGIRPNIENTGARLFGVAKTTRMFGCLKKMSAVRM
jgi:hypothetical protein